MKISNLIILNRCLLLVIFIIIFVLAGCERIDLVRIIKISTIKCESITTVSAQVSCEFIDFGNEEILEYGICWALNMIPEITDNLVISGQEPIDDSFTVLITGLKQNQHYFTRAYARTNDTVVYGHPLYFKTLNIEIPSVTTKQPTGITKNSATSGGNVTDNGNGQVIVRGICWGIDTYPTIRDNKTDNGTGMGEFTSQITGLIPGVTYYVRAYVSNEAGTGYGDSFTFKTFAAK